MKALFVKNWSSEDPFQKFLTVSFAAHLVIFFGVTIKNFLFPAKTLVVQNAIRVDMVALPDKLPAQPQPAAPVEKPKAPEPVKEIKPVAEPVKPKPDTKSVNLKKAQQDALNRLRQQEALARLNKTQESAPAAPKKTLYLGNQLSKGNSATGLEKIAAEDYANEIKQRVNSNFTLPSWLADAPLKASIEVIISSSGKIERITIVQTSGNQTFDHSAVSAIEASLPFPPLPERVTRTWGSLAIQFDFPEHVR